MFHIYNVPVCTYVQYFLVLLFVLPVILRTAGETRIVCTDRNFLLDLTEPTGFCQTQGKHVIHVAVRILSHIFWSS